MKSITSVLLSVLLTIALSACDNRPSEYGAAPITSHPTSYYVGNTMYGRWELSPSGHQVWVMHPQYGHLGHSSLDLILAVGMTHMFYRSVWSSSYPGGWGSAGTYDHQRSEGISKTIINNYGGVAGLKKAATEPVFQKKRDEFKKSGKGLPEPTKSMKLAHTSNTKKNIDTKKTIPKTATPTKPISLTEQRALAKKSYSYTPPVKQTYRSSYKPNSRRK